MLALPLPAPGTMAGNGRDCQAALSPGRVPSSGAQLPANESTTAIPEPGAGLAPQVVAEGFPKAVGSSLADPILPLAKRAPSSLGHHAQMGAYGAAAALPLIPPHLTPWLCPVAWTPQGSLGLPCPAPSSLARKHYLPLLLSMTRLTVGDSRILACTLCWSETKETSSSEPCSPASPAWRSHAGSFTSDL